MKTSKENDYGLDEIDEFFESIIQLSKEQRRRQMEDGVCFDEIYCQSNDSPKQIIEEALRRYYATPPDVLLRSND